ncbi:MAG: site-specific integrase [Nitrosopumilus sp.]|nr:site-specific integrase [Nitrosopumilus sp.]NRA05414.1 site-specific integrase [Nitrosopumilus sp.]
MELTIENIQEIEDPYNAFVNSVRNTETLRKYKNQLHVFLKLIPGKIYEDVLGKTPENDTLEHLSTMFVELADKDSKTVYNIIATYIKEDRKKVEQKLLRPNSFSNHIKSIRKLLDANAIAISWKSLHQLYPRGSVSKDRAYTRDELQKMINTSPDLVDKVIVALFSSAGFRLESWDYFIWKDVIFFKNDDDTFKGGALLVYHGDPESYWTHITPEACNLLQEYRELWKSQIGVYPNPKDPLLKTTKTPVVRRLKGFGVKRRVDRLARRIGMRNGLVDGQSRYDVPLDHGFRKYFNTMLRRAKVDYLDKEDMMGHTTGLEKHYERYNEEDFERFSEYEKAIPFRTISDTERVKLENVNLRREKTELQKTQEKLEHALVKIDELWADKQRMENSTYTYD